MKGQLTYMFHLHNSIRTYHWGSPDAISSLLGLQTDATPQAELWLGAHPGNPSRLRETGQGLDELLADTPQLLGQAVSDRYGQLPFLMKVLAADQPLSIQVHPSLEQAAAGFEREEQAGIGRDAAHRNYKDANHKPEMLYALGDFVALSGFRAPARIIADLQRLQPWLSEPAAAISRELVDVLDREEDPLGQALARVLGGDQRIGKLVDEMVTAITAHPQLRQNRQLDELAWAAGYYPADPGVLVTLLMNVVDLKAGEVICMQAGYLHAYLRGVGIEVMANSDNVLRGGLTSKHIDVPELLAITHTQPGQATALSGATLGPGNTLYTPDFDEFQLQVLQLSAEGRAQQLACHGAGIALCTGGSFTLQRDGRQLQLHRGDSVFLPAGSPVLAQVLDGTDATLFLASAQTPGD